MKTLTDFFSEMHISMHDNPSDVEQMKASCIAFDDLLEIVRNHMKELSAATWTASVHYTCDHHVIMLFNLADKIERVAPIVYVAPIRTLMRNKIHPLVKILTQLFVAQLEKERAQKKQVAA